MTLLGAEEIGGPGRPPGISLLMQKVDLWMNSPPTMSANNTHSGETASASPFALPAPGRVAHSECPFLILALSTNGHKHTRLDKIIFESPEVCAEPSIGHCGFNSTGNSNDAIEFQMASLL